MARHEQDREDILREATALVRRVELELPEFAEPVVVGFRRDGSASFYFGVALVLQFNSRDELRRGFHEGRLLKAEGGKLVCLERHRTDTEVELRSHALTDEESNEFLQHAERQLDLLRAAFRTGRNQVLRQVPAGAEIASEIAAWLERQGDQLAVAKIPNAG